jgi:hypothetical protein
MGCVLEIHMFLYYCFLLSFVILFGTFMYRLYEWIPDQYHSYSGMVKIPRISARGTDSRTCKSKRFLCCG